jgi:hypothetical protein
MARNSLESAVVVCASADVLAGVLLGSFVVHHAACTAPMDECVRRSQD